MHTHNKFRLGCINIANDVGTIASFLTSNSSINALDLSGCKISVQHDNGVDALCDTIAKSECLLDLSVAGNGFIVSDPNLIANVLAVNTRLTRIDLFPGNRLDHSDAGLVELFRTLRCNKSLKELSFGCKFVDLCRGAFSQ